MKQAQREITALMHANGMVDLLVANQVLHIGQDFVTPEMFGAMGNDTIPDDIAIEAAITYAKTHGIKKVLFANKTYILTEPIDLTGVKNLWLCGGSFKGNRETDSTILSITEDCSEAITFDNTNYSKVSGFTLINNSTASNTIGIHYADSHLGTNASRSRSNLIEDVIIYDFYNGIQIDSGTGYDRFENVSVNNCSNTCVTIGADAQVTSGATIIPNYIYFNNCKYSDTAICVDIRYATFIYFNNNDFVDGVGVQIITNKIIGVAITNSVFWCTTDPLLITVACNDIVMDSSNTIRIAEKNNTGEAITAHGVTINSPVGYATSLKINPMFTIYTGFTAPLITIKGHLTDVFVDCNWPTGYTPASFPIDRETNLPVNFYDLIKRGCKSFTVAAGDVAQSIALKTWIKGGSFMVVRRYSNTDGSAGEIVPITGLTTSGNTLTFTTHNTYANSIDAILIPLGY